MGRYKAEKAQKWWYVVRDGVKQSKPMSKARAEKLANTLNFGRDVSNRSKANPNPLTALKQVLGSTYRTVKAKLVNGQLHIIPASPKRKAPARRSNAAAKPRRRNPPGARPTDKPTMAQAKKAAPETRYLMTQRSRERFKGAKWAGYNGYPALHATDGSVAYFFKQGSKVWGAILTPGQAEENQLVHEAARPRRR